MRGYAFEIRRVPLRRFDGALPHHPAVYLSAPGDAGTVVDRGKIDRATPDVVDVLRRELARLSEGDAGPARYVVAWLRTPIGRHARLFRGLTHDAGAAR